MILKKIYTLHGKNSMLQTFKIFQNMYLQLLKYLFLATSPFVATVRSPGAMIETFFTSLASSVHYHLFRCSYMYIGHFQRMLYIKAFLR